MRHDQLADQELRASIDIEGLGYQGSIVAQAGETGTDRRKLDAGSFHCLAIFPGRSRQYRDEDPRGSPGLSGEIASSFIGTPAVQI